MFQRLSCLPYVLAVFFFLACAKSAHMFQNLSYSLCGCCLSFLTLTLPQTVRLSTFHYVLRLPNSSLRVWPARIPQQQYTMLSFSSMRRHGHSHKLTSSRALWYYTVSIPFCSSHKRQTRTSKFNGKNHNTTCSKSRDHTLLLRTCYGEVYGNIACEENGWLSCGI